MVVGVTVARGFRTGPITPDVGFTGEMYDGNNAVGAKGAADCRHDMSGSERSHVRYSVGNAVMSYAHTHAHTYI